MAAPLNIDRVTPTFEPDAQVVMYQNWHHLLFLHWEIQPSALHPLLPQGLDLDTFEGKAYVGLIPFTLSGVRPILMPPLPGVSTFDEINLRTYVHVKGQNPGVWFFSLDASSRLAVEAARNFYKLPYFHARMEFAAAEVISMTTHRDDERGAQPAHAHIKWRPVEGPIAPAAVGSLDHFLCERYILYAADERKDLWRARVHHQPYPLQRAELLELEETMVWAAGIRRGEEVPIRHYAREVNVQIYGLESVSFRA